MAEATTLAPEVTQPEVEAAPTPEVALESTPEVNEEDSELDAVLSTFGDGVETDATNGPANSDDGTPVDPYAGLTPAQIAEKVRVEEAEKLTQQSTSQQTQAYLNGLARVVQENPQKLIDFAERLGIMGDDRKELTAAFNDLHGAYAQLYRHSTSQNQAAVKKSFEDEYYQGTVKALGKETAEAIYKDNPSWEVFHERVGEEWAKKNGYASKKDVAAAKNEAQKSILKKVDDEMRKSGYRLSQFTGTANPSVPSPRGGGGGLPTFDAFNRMDIAEQEKFTPEQRQQIYQNDAARRARG